MSKDVYIPLFYEQLPVGTAPIGLASIPAGAGPNGANFARLRVESAPIRFLDTGATPNPSVGQPLTPSDPALLYQGGAAGLAQLLVAAPSTATAILNVTYYT